MRAQIFFIMNLVFTALSAASLMILTITDPGAVLPSFIGGAVNALKLSLTLFGSYSFWLSAIKIYEQCGITEKLKKIFKPIIKRLYPDESEKTLTHISTNVAANFIGAGGAATPEGLKAAESIAHRKNKVMLVVMNATAFQVIPATVVAMRSAYGATEDIILPSVIAAAITSLSALTLTKIFVR